MPLLNMTSDLTSLKYGRDRRGGGNSGQPYFTKDIPERLKSINFANSFLGNDFLIRGGTRSVTAVLQDEVRLGKFFSSLKSPNGLLFIAKQNLLAKQNPLTGADPDRVYNPLNTLAQAAVNPIGLHFAKDGRSLNIDDNDKYFARTKNTPGENAGYNTSVLGTESKNKLLLLYETNIITPLVNNPKVPSNEPGNLKFLLDDLEASSLSVTQFRSNLGIFGISEDPQLLFQYMGGPNSLLGQKTAVRKFSDTNEGINRNKTTQQTLVYTQDLLRTRIKATTTGFSSDGISNFASIFTLGESRAFTGIPDEKRKQLIGEPTDYTQFNRASTYGESDPGASIRDKSVYYTTNLSSLAKNDPNIFAPDSINAQPLYSSNNESARKGKGYDDSVKFNIGVIDLDSTSNPKNTTWIHFKASFSNLSDSFNADWQSYKYMGRGNNFYKYNGFTRQISLGFNIAVHSRYEQAFIYDKLNYLASIITPNYSPGGFMRGNLIKLTVGDYLNNTMGILNAVNFTIPDEASWDIGRDLEGNEDPNSFQLPQMINVNQFQFTPISNFLERSVSPKYAKGEFARPDENYISMGTNASGYDSTFEARKNSNQVNSSN